MGAGAPALRRGVRFLRCLVPLPRRSRDCRGLLGERDVASPTDVIVVLLPEVEAAVDETAAMIGALDAARWGRPCEAEGWPVAVTALHIALGLRRQASFIALARDGQAPFTFDWEATHALNARVATRGAPRRRLSGASSTRGDRACSGCCPRWTRRSFAAWRSPFMATSS